MYKSMLFLHWKQIRHALAFLVVVSFALPLMAVRGVGMPPGMGPGAEAYHVISAFQPWLPFFPLLAAGIGITLALSAWNWDHQLNHVYALSLPVTRWEYTLQKMLAGATLAVVPVLGLWLGARLAAVSVELPEGLHAYPDELAVRFLFAILLAYAAWFAMAAGTVRTALWVLGSVVGLMFFGAILSDFLGDHYQYFAQMNLVERIMNWVAYAPGPLEVFSGSWSLIDV